MTLESRSFAITRPPHISLLFDVILSRRPFQAAYFSCGYSAIASCVSWLLHVTSKSSDEEKCLAWVKWLPVTFRSHRHSHRLTDKCKISNYNDTLYDCNNYYSYEKWGNLLAILLLFTSVHCKCHKLNHESKRFNLLIIIATRPRR